MKSVGKIKVILSWGDGNYSCQFKRGRDQEEWPNMTKDEQTLAVGAMFTMGKLYEHFIKKDEG